MKIRKRNWNFVIKASNHWNDDRAKRKRKTSIMKEAVLEQGMFLKKGNYQIQKLVYRGSSCDMYLAKEQESGKMVVVKEFCPKIEEFKENVYDRLKQAFLEECRITKFLQGKEGFVQFLDQFEENHTIYLILEFISGRSYLDFIKECQNKHQIQAIRGCLCRICENVEWLHSKHILHRDIKPSNVLITEDGVPVLLDFGSAIWLTKEAVPVCSVSRRYAPPEFYRHKVGGRYSDYYALGILICQSLPEEKTGFFLSCLIGQMLNPNPYLRLIRVGWLKKAIALNI